MAFDNSRCANIFMRSYRLHLCDHDPNAIIELRFRPTPYQYVNRFRDGPTLVSACPLEDLETQYYQPICGTVYFRQLDHPGLLFKPDQLQARLQRFFSSPNFDGVTVLSKGERYDFEELYAMHPCERTPLPCERALSHTCR